MVVSRGLMWLHGHEKFASKSYDKCLSMNWIPMLPMAFGWKRQELCCCGVQWVFQLGWLAWMDLASFTPIERSFPRQFCRGLTCQFVSWHKFRQTDPFSFSRARLEDTTELRASKAESHSPCLGQCPYHQSSIHEEPFLDFFLQARAHRGREFRQALCQEAWRRTLARWVTLAHAGARAMGAWFLWLK